MKDIFNHKATSEDFDKFADLKNSKMLVSVWLMYWR